MGCVAASATPCASSQACDEESDTCGIDCDANGDADGDGVRSMACGGHDCDDEDSNRFPGNLEVCDEEGVDEDCDPATFGNRDADRDGHVDAACCNGTSCGDDCDDGRADVFDGTTEVCDGVDSDCDGLVDEGVLVELYADGDGDGFGAGPALRLCPGTPGHSVNAGDCDDDDPSRSPLATELCASDVDEDCDTRIDESGPRLFFRDADGDGYGDPGDTTMTASCTPPAGYVGNSRDCADGNAAVHPGALDLCNGVDDDCSIPGSGGIELSEDRDMDGHSPSTAACTGGYPKDDCNDSMADTHGGASELCDGRDNDCSTGGGTAPEEDGDGDRHSPPAASCAGGYPRNDCDDGDATVYGGAIELCDRIDNDCSSGGGAQADEDADDDGHAPSSATCSGGRLPKDDCDDTRATVYPGAPELCDRLDNDCSSGGGELAAEDADGDMHTATSYAACSGGFPRDDCDDSRGTVYPGAPELCDRLDNDCSSGGGELAAEDADGDMHTATSYAACSGGFPRDDCDDSRGTVYPGAPELCDGRDSDCSSGGGAVPAEDADGDMHTATGFTGCTGGYPRDDCDDADDDVYPGAPLVPPALIGPVNGAQTGSAWSSGSLRPTFRWSSASCSATATYELQVDDSCTTPGFASCGFASPELTQSSIAGTSFRPSAGLPVSTTAPVGRRYHWRARTCEGATCSAWSAVRYLDVGRVTSDLDGDGYSDVVAASFRFDAAWDEEGIVVVHFGGPTGATGARALSFPSPGPDRAHFGYAISSAGDLDGDGFADLIVGAPGIDQAGARGGSVFVYRGGTTPSTTPSVTLRNPASQSAGSFGESATHAGDLNGDGFGDLAVAAPWQDAGASNEGSVFVYHGSTSLVATTPDRAIDSPRNMAQGLFGATLAGRGDHDGDGYADLVVGAPNHPHVSGEIFVGMVFVYPGSASGVAAVASTSLDSPVAVRDGYFGKSLAMADVDGDGRADLLVAAPDHTVDDALDGAVYLYRGRASGISPTHSQRLDHPSGIQFGRFGYSIAQLGDLDGDGRDEVAFGMPYDFDDGGPVAVYAGTSAGTLSYLFDRRSPAASADFGWSLCGSIDANGDGAPDLVVGAPFERRVFVYHGASSSFSFGAALEPPSAQSDQGWGEVTAR